MPPKTMREVPRRVAVTGLGLVTPIGIGSKTVWRNLLDGRSGIGPVESFDTGPYPVDLGAEVRDFDADDHLRELDPRRLGRASLMAAVAARLATADAGLGPELDPVRTSVVMGTTSGEPHEIERFNDRRVAGDSHPLDAGFLRRYPCHSIAHVIAAELGVSGQTLMVPTACAAGNYAIAHGFELLRRREAETVLVGGADAFSRITFTGFSRLGAVASERCRPFDRNRDGMIPGEGAGVLVLEDLDRARERGASIYAEVAGYGLSCDAHHMTAAHPEGDGAVRAMRRALEASDVPTDRVSYISAHGTGTPTNDRLESLAFHRVFAAAAARIPMSSVKSMIGHAMGAASAIEAAVCCLAVATGSIPPTTNYEQRDPDCDVDCVPNTARELEVEVAMNNAYAFGGSNASVLFRNPETTR